jgi:probable HAF family extracellular repeat protein
MSKHVPLARAAAMAALLGACAGAALAGPLYHVINTGLDGYGSAINDAGAVAGDGSGWQDGNPIFKWQDGMTTVLQSPGLGGDAWSLNSGGVAVGSVWINGGSDFTAVRWNADGSMVNLGTLPGDKGSEAFGINAVGTIVGYSMRPDFSTHSMIVRDGHMEELDPVAAYGAAYAVNAGGQVTGERRPPGARKAHAYLYTDGLFKNLGSLGGASSGLAINSKGHVAGRSEIQAHGTGNDHRAFLWNGRKMKNLGTLAGNSTAIGINDDDQVLGYSEAVHESLRPWVWIKGTMYELEQSLDAGSQGWTLYDDKGAINNKGQIVLRGSRDGEHNYVLILDPVKQ